MTFVKVHKCLFVENMIKEIRAVSADGDFQTVNDFFGPCCLGFHVVLSSRQKEIPEDDINQNYGKTSKFTQFYLENFISFQWS